MSKPTSSTDKTMNWTEVLNTPERFVRKPPKPPHIPAAVWITPPKQTA
jgi:hypothetical protein